MKIMAKKFTFKTEKSTGSYSSFYNDTHYIKLNKIECGTISDDEKHIISLQVIKDDINSDENKNCEWKWIKLNKESQTLQEAKDFLNANFENINSKYRILQ